MRRTQNSQRGQTILLVAVSLVTLLGLAALAIDVVTLYVARSEAQRAADAAALAGAKTLVDTGLTTDPCNATLANAAQTLAINQAQLVAQQNAIGGQAAGTITVTFPNGGSPSCGLATPSPFGINPQVKVVVQRSGLPTFFARVWGQGLGTVSATALAEAYNPSNSGSLNATGNVIPISPRCVKPMILPNCDPTRNAGVCPLSGANNNTFVTPATGQITNPGLNGGVGIGGVINEALTATTGHPLLSACNTPGCAPQAITAGKYYPITLPSSALNLCPGNGNPNCNSGATGFEQGAACCNFPSPGLGVACGQQIAFDPSTNPEGGPVQNGLRCMIHQQPGGGQDQIDATTSAPTEFIAGDNNPFVGTSIQAGDHILNSDSVATIPLFDQQVTTLVTGSTQFTVIGFLQVFISQVHNNGRVDAYILNVSGCGSSPAGPAIQGSGSPVPVRLIQTQ